MQYTHALHPCTARMHCTHTPHAGTARMHSHALHACVCVCLSGSGRKEGRCTRGARASHDGRSTRAYEERVSTAPPLEGRIYVSALCAQGATIALTRHTVLRCTRAPSAQPHFAALLLRNDRRAPRATLTHTPSATHPQGTPFSLQRVGLCEAHRIYEAIAEGKVPTH